MGMGGYVPMPFGGFGGKGQMPQPTPPPPAPLVSAKLIICLLCIEESVNRCQYQIFAV